MQYSVLVFDWDGTLMDSTPSIVTAIQNACRDLDLPVPPASSASWVIGLSLDAALTKVVPDLPPSLLPRFIERYRIHYLLRDPDLRLFDGVPELLADLGGQGARLAVATGKSRVGLDRVIRGFGLEGVFEATRCADETHSKPHPAMLNELMEELMVAPEEVLMIGDTSHDMRMAANAGVHGLGVSYGAHPLPELLAGEPLHVVDSVSAMRDWIQPRLRA
ncbi:HAD-IA family hydrolase [Kerstersia similis]|uniref:HAD-IA family hydrolase n=1 Tax=Kerstersia similis TaxID=206505 RepID=UPI0039F0D128